MELTLKSAVKLKLPWRQADTFISAVHSRTRVSGLTHDFYKYPARFSPEFARATITSLSRPGDIIADPFMGGGTSLVEARATGRLSVGCDISSLATFVARAKTQVLSPDELHNVSTWLQCLPDNINLRIHSSNENIWAERGYFKHLNGPSTWPIRKFIELALPRLYELPGYKQRVFARCVMLRTAQWAIDGRKTIPNIATFRHQFREIASRMTQGSQDFSAMSLAADKLSQTSRRSRILCINSPASRLPAFYSARHSNAPKLVLTSPPYPGVHMLYHRWQLFGGKESPAPFWIANRLDGAGESHYLMHARKDDKTRYFGELEAALKPLVVLAKRDTTFVQLVAFSDPQKQLPKYLETMERCGLREHILSEHIDSHDGRLWRTVPNRRWHAQSKGALESSREVVLLHRPS